MLRGQGPDAGAASIATSRSTRAPARCSASTASWAAARSNWRARCSASCRPDSGIAGDRRRASSGSPTPPRASAPASAMSPESRRAMLFREEPIYRNVSIAFLEYALALAARSRRAERAQARDADAAPRRPPARRRGAARRALRRQPAEGRARQMADPAAARCWCWPSRRAAWTSAPRRTSCGSCKSLAAEGMAVDRALDRAGDRAFARRPRARHAQGRDRAANSRIARSARTACWRRLEERSVDGCA